jgi:alcohol dehydrogenase
MEATGPGRGGETPRTWRLPSGPSPLICSGGGALDDLGDIAREFVHRRALVTSDPGIVAAGIADRALASLRAAGVSAELFSDFGENPSEADVARAAAAARTFEADTLVGVGGGSSLDVAKGAGFLLAGGGRMEDYRGYDRCPHPLPPLIGVPTTAGTGSEAQSYALISRDRDHQKLACGAPTAMFRAVVLDPALLPSAPPDVIAATGFDSIAHAVETAVTADRTEESVVLSHRAFALLSRAFPLVTAGEGADGDWEDMQLGAFLAGAAIERSMLGAAHACANPLTRRFDVAHGRALAITLPRVVRWNAPAAREDYRELLEAAGIPGGANPAATLADLLTEWIAGAGLPPDLDAERVAAEELPSLANEAAQEWTGRFNPRSFSAGGALAVYRSAVA